MSKTIYEEAINDVENLHKCLGDKSSRDISAKNILHALEKAMKQVKLLECYKTLITIKDDMLSCCAIVDDDYYDIDKTATHFEQQIKVLEELLK